MSVIIVNKCICQIIIIVILIIIFFTAGSLHSTVNTLLERTRLHDSVSDDLLSQINYCITSVSVSEFRQRVG